MVLNLVGFGAQFLLYDVPLFLLFFGVTIIVLKFLVRVQDPIMNTAIAAVAASLAFMLVRDIASVQRWFFWNSSGTAGIAVILIFIAAFVFVFTKFK